MSQSSEERTSFIGSQETIHIKYEPFVTVDTLVQNLEYSAVITLNILVVLWYDEAKFHRVSILWAIFAFSYTYSLDGWTILPLFEVAQYFLYLWFCSWTILPLVVFTMLLIVMLGSKLLSTLFYRFCVTQQTDLVHNNSHNRLREHKCFLFRNWFNLFGIITFLTTVPLFYFNQNALWGTIAFAETVVIVLWNDTLMKIIKLLFRDYYVTQILNDMAIKHDNKCNKQLLEYELKKPIKQHRYE